MTKRVVVIGGGNSSAMTLEALKPLADKFEISAIVSVSDSGGGSTGRLIKEFKTLPPGDIMRAILSMSKYDYKMLKQIFYRNRFFGVGKLDKHDLGNLFLVLSEKYCGDYMSAVRALEQAIEAKGHVYPATLERNDLCVQLTNGKTVKTEAKIDRPDYNRNLKIVKAWLEPKVTVYSEAKKALAAADYIILCPGSVYTSLIPVLLTGGVKEIIKKSKAKLWYTAFIAYDLVGETGPTTLSGCVQHLEKYLLRPIDLIVYNNHKSNRRQLEGYRERKWRVTKKDVENLPGRDTRGFDYEAENGGMEAEKLAEVFKKLLK